MMRWIAPLAVFIVTAVGAHWATLAYAPGVIMDRALSTLKDRGIAEHAFTTPKRITPQTQAVVRSSPDLFYSLCRYDLSKPEKGDRGTYPYVEIDVSAWDGYQSLSFFDEETNNFATIRSSGRARRVRLHERYETSERTLKINGVETTILNSPTKRGVILIRRLAPTKEAFEQAKWAGRYDRCSYSQPNLIVE